MSNFKVTDEELIAFADGELDEPRRTAVSEYLYSNPDKLLLIRDLVLQRQVLRQAFDEVLSDPIPESLLKAANGSNQSGFWDRVWKTQWLKSNLVGFATVGLAMLFGVAIGWLSNEFTKGFLESNLTDQLVEQSAKPEFNFAKLAAVAHVVYSPDQRRPVEVTAADSIQLTTWLSNRMGTKIVAPDLRVLNLELMGGRLLPGESQPVAQLMYHDALGQRITLYVTNERLDRNTTGFLFTKQGPVNVFYWINDGFGYALSAGISKSELAKIASVIQDQF